MNMENAKVTNSSLDFECTKDEAAMAKANAKSDKFRLEFVDNDDSQNTSMDSEWEQNQIVHIATDGESFGHHISHGDMTIAYCLHHIETISHVSSIKDHIFQI